jgi:hypothetical protein
LRAVFWAAAAEPVTSRAEGEALIRDMYAAGLTYHFEDSPADIYNTADGQNTFTPPQATLVDARIRETYATWGGKDADDCPIGFLLELMKAAGELPPAEPSAELVALHALFVEALDWQEALGEPGARPSLDEAMSAARALLAPHWAFPPAVEGSATDGQ